MIKLRKIRRAYSLTTVNHDDTTTSAVVARFPSRRWVAATMLLVLPTTKLTTTMALSLAWRTRVVVIPPTKPAKAARSKSGLRESHQAGLEALTKPPSRVAMALAILGLLAAIGWRIYQAWPPAPKPAGTNPASLVHEGHWVGPLEHCHGTGVYTDHTGRCVVAPAR